MAQSRNYEAGRDAGRDADRDTSTLLLRNLMPDPGSTVTNSKLSAAFAFLRALQNFFFSDLFRLSRMCADCEMS